MDYSVVKDRYKSKFNLHLVVVLPVVEINPQLAPRPDPLAQDGHLPQFGMAAQCHLCLKKSQISVSHTTLMCFRCEVNKECVTLSMVNI